MARQMLAAVIVSVAAALLAAGSASAALSNYTWTGAQGPGSSGNYDYWSQNNWNVASPISDQSLGTLTFPDLGAGCNNRTATLACYSSDDDITGLSANAITIDDTVPYQILDQPLTLGAGGITATPQTSPASGLRPHHLSPAHPERQPEPGALPGTAA